MTKSKTLADLIKKEEKISESVFKDENGQEYRPIKIEMAVFVTYLKNEVIKNRYITLKEARGHEYVSPYKRQTSEKK